MMASALLAGVQIARHTDLRWGLGETIGVGAACLDLGTHCPIGLEPLGGRGHNGAIYSHRDWSFLCRLFAA